LRQIIILLVEVSHLTKHFRDIKAVDDLSFSVKEGEIYGFLGQNGAGKSTTIRMLLSLIRPDSGEIRIFEKSLAKDRPGILGRVGAIIERPDHYKYLTACENLALFARLSGVKADRSTLMKYLEGVGLKDRSHSKVSTFSMGMKQRLGLAIALVHEPRLLILDEPANGLDPQGIADVRQLITDLSRKEGKTIIISSHLLSEMEQLADSMLIMDKGKKIIEGKVSELLDPSRSIVQVQTTDNDHVMRKLSAGPFAGKARLSDRVIRFQMNRDEVPALAKEIQDSGVGLISIHTRHSLEEYFLSLTNQDPDVAVASN
jgi:ABC-type multidrug transport system ATPase subunit